MQPESARRSQSVGALSTSHANGSETRSKSPQRVGTDPTSRAIERVKKRIVVCCDGTWQDGISENRRLYTNVLRNAAQRLARTMNQEDVRTSPPTPQIVFYQSGIGTEKNFYSEYVDGTTGGTLADKVEEAYAFIAHNYFPGDEIYLFGFSRGAYTVRMVAMLIGEIGVLDRKNMDHFGKLYVAYQLLGKADDAKERAEAQAEVERYKDKISDSLHRSLIDEQPFSVKCLGVFDTVGSLGLPEELTIGSSRVKTLFGLPDRILGDHIERAYQALALNEPRKNFDCTRMEQTDKGRTKNQILSQCWFTGSHSDIGGGYYNHDLADITLTWMMANISDMLSMDMAYLASIFYPAAPWGALEPHDPVTGIFRLGLTTTRTLPTSHNEVTHETIHPSVFEQPTINEDIRKLIDEHPDLVAKLLPLEEEMKTLWPYEPGKVEIRDEKGKPVKGKTVGAVSKLLGKVADTVS
ncbi:hypothetical protein PQX77_003836 [Marasmius sp. AFHP31]|nr:hypothetical protein PQX77_003836 [Marasmius sp. AFHP31]